MTNARGSLKTFAVFAKKIFSRKTVVINNTCADSSSYILSKEGDWQIFLPILAGEGAESRDCVLTFVRDECSFCVHRFSPEYSRLARDDLSRLNLGLKRCPLVTLVTVLWFFYPPNHRQRQAWTRREVEKRCIFGSAPFVSLHRRKKDSERGKDDKHPGGRVSWSQIRRLL
jgi:hypothetical protein